VFRMTQQFMEHMEVSLIW